MLMSVCCCLCAGDIRCYCNDASCVSTGYMCKSAIGRCFSQLSYETTDNARSAHGCVETLPPRDRSVCESEGDIIKNKNGPDDEWPLLMCCNEDMCNYQENVDIVNTKANGSILKGGCLQGNFMLFQKKYLEVS